MKKSHVLAIGVIGILIGIFSTYSIMAWKTFNLPTKQEAIAFLSKPLPVPKEAQYIDLNYLDRQVGKDSLYWKKQFLLDVTKLNYNKIQEIPDNYAEYFRSLIRPGHFGGNNAKPAFMFNKYQLAMDGGAPWSRELEIRGKHYLMILKAEIIDFDESIEIANKFPIKNIIDPIKGRRTMWIQINVWGYGLRPDDTKWPDS